MADAKTVIRGFIVREIMSEKDESILGFDDPLLDTGIMDSLGILELVGFLHEEFSVSIPEQDLVPEYFETIRAITDYLAMKTASRKA